MAWLFSKKKVGLVSRAEDRSVLVSSSELAPEMMINENDNLRLKRINMFSILCQATLLEFCLR